MSEANPSRGGDAKPRASLRRGSRVATASRVPRLRRKEGVVVRKCVVLLALSLALGLLSVLLMGAARVVEVPCGQDLDATVNADPAATATLFQLEACNYNVDHTVVLKA